MQQQLHTKRTEQNAPGVWFFFLLFFFKSLRRMAYDTNKETKITTKTKTESEKKSYMIFDF